MLTCDAFGCGLDSFECDVGCECAACEPGGVALPSEPEMLAAIDRWEAESSVFGVVWGDQLRAQVKDSYRAQRLLGGA